MASALELTSLYAPNASVKILANEPCLVAISMVKNEGDIISAWMSHICSLFDAIYIVDHISTDGTREFLLDIAANEGDLHIYSFNHPGYFQAEITNQLAQIAALQYRDSWLFPLDADEFLAIEHKEDLRRLIRSVSADRVLRMPWKNCIPIYLMADQEFNFGSPCLLPPREGTYQKLAIHSSGIIRKDWKFDQGAHEILKTTGEPLGQDVQTDFTDLFHLPLRSIDHFVLKCVQGYEAYNALPPERKRDGQGFHWTDMITQVTKEGMLDPSIVRRYAMRYGQPHLSSNQGTSIYNLIDAGWVCGPLAVAHIEPWPKLSKRQGFLELTNQILARSDRTGLEMFVHAARNNLVSGLTHGRNGNAICANEAKFTRLPEIASMRRPTKSDSAIICEFISKAFSPHQHPVPSAWESHIPFLFCLLGYARPRRFVELGSHYGNCFFAACQASREIHCAIESVAIDTWQGDKHAGSYEEDVLQQFTHILEHNYSACGKYIRKTFNEAAQQFEPGSIDLLHIDGLHTYEAVSHDFETWLPKMSDQGIVMFHDTREHQQDFGVWRLWAEIENLYPSFEFEHGHGLGIVLTGDNPAGAIRALFDVLSNKEYANLMRLLFSNLGKLSPILVSGHNAVSERDT